MTSKNCHSIEQLATNKIGFIGAGNMARAIIDGLVQAGQTAELISCSNPSLGKLEQLNAKHTAIRVSQSNQLIAEQSHILVLAVKPQKMSLALDSIKSLDLSDKLIISVAAGVESATINKLLGQSIPVIRAMPNTPAMIGIGATGLFANSLVNEQQKTQATAIFNAVGMCVWIEQESQMDLVTAISGSGPAHYFYFLEAVIASAIEQGMTADTAKQLAAQTALGAAQMVMSNQQTSVTELRAQVTSPGGTTAAAIESFQNDQFAEIIDRALKTSVKRGKQLSELAKDI